MDRKKIGYAKREYAEWWVGAWTWTETWFDLKKKWEKPADEVIGEYGAWVIFIRMNIVTLVLDWEVRCWVLWTFLLSFSFCGQKKLVKDDEQTNEWNAGKGRESTRLKSSDIIRLNCHTSFLSKPKSILEFFFPSILPFHFSLHFAPQALESLSNPPRTFRCPSFSRASPHSCQFSK